MPRGRDPRPLIIRLRSGWEWLHEFASVGYAVVFFLVVPVLLLMGLGLAVRGLSDVAGAPLPYVHDDPNRVEWDGLGELVGYGIVGALVLYGVYLLAKRLPAFARRHLGRVIGVAVLLALAASGLVVGIGDRSLREIGFGVACGYFAFRVVRGLPLDENNQEHQPNGREAAG